MLPKKLLGSTGINISSLTLGTVKFGRNTNVKYPKKFDLPDMKTCGYLLDLAYDLGFNIIDTAPAYGLSEQIIGELLKTRKHQDWVVCTKGGENYNTKTQISNYDFSQKKIKASIENSLKMLNKDYLDIFLLHSNGDDLKILNDPSLIDYLSKLKADGKIRACGISSKTIEGGLLAAELFDCVMVEYNLNNQSQLPVIQKAYDLNKGVLIKKGLSSGHAFINNNILNKNLLDKDPIDASIKFILKTKGVTSLVIGTINPEHLKKNVRSSEA